MGFCPWLYYRTLVLLDSWISSCCCCCNPPIRPELGLLLHNSRGNVGATRKLSVAQDIDID